MQPQDPADSDWCTVPRYGHGYSPAFEALIARLHTRAEAAQAKTDAATAAGHPGGVAASATKAKADATDSPGLAFKAAQTAEARRPKRTAAVKGVSALAALMSGDHDDDVDGGGAAAAEAASAAALILAAAASAPVAANLSCTGKNYFEINASSQCKHRLLRHSACTSYSHWPNRRNARGSRSGQYDTAHVSEPLCAAGFHDGDNLTG